MNWNDNQNLSFCSLAASLLARNKQLAKLFPAPNQYNHDDRVG